MNTVNDQQKFNVAESDMLEEQRDPPASQ